MVVSWDDGRENGELLFEWSFCGVSGMVAFIGV